MEFIIKLVPLIVKLELSASLDPFPLIKEKTRVSLVSESTADKEAIVELADTVSRKVVDEIPISVGALFKSITAISKGFVYVKKPSLT